MSTKPVSAVRLAQTSAILARLSGLDPSVSPRVAAAVKLLDSETASSIPSIMRSFEQRRAAIEADKNLSDIGKAEQIRAAAASWIGNIATRAKQLTDLEAEYEADKSSAVPLPQASVNDCLIDIALAAHVKSLDLIPSRLVELPERLRLAVARVPNELSGTKPEVHARVHGSLMSPAKAAQLSSEAQAIGAAREVAQAAITELAPAAKWTPQEMVTHFGSKWRLPGIHPDSAQRLAEGDGGND
jgi:hypothetical protein